MPPGLALARCLALVRHIPPAFSARGNAQRKTLGAGAVGTLQNRRKTGDNTVFQLTTSTEPLSAMSLPSSGTRTAPALILASTSIYRRELLSRLRLPFVVEPPHVDETPRPGEAPAALALRLALAKARAVSAQHPGALVIGSDQVATLGGEPIGKPGGFEQAHAQLRQLSGQEVAFHSALAVTDGSRDDVRDVITLCRFRTLTDAAITRYLRTERPYDTAGSAKAESLGIALMAEMRSDDPTAIIGLPLIALTDMLTGFGLDPLDQLEQA